MKLFTIGDSISQGFMSGAAARTDLCYSTLIAQQLGIAGYQYPEWQEGGIPLNIENLFRTLEDQYGSSVNSFEWASAIAFSIPSFLDKTERFYERGKGAANKRYQGGGDYFHNVSVRGFNVSDSWLITPKYCRDEMAKKKSRDGIYASVDHSFLRTALRVLNPNLMPEHDEKSQLGWLEYHTQKEGVENVVVWLGANNALGTILDLNINYTGGNKEVTTLPSDQYKDGEGKTYNLWHPKDFQADYTELLDRIDKILEGRDTKVFIGTVPLVTIAPLAKGMGETFTVVVENQETRKKEPATYFKYYTYFPFDEDFAFKSGINLSFSQALHIDNCIREYNKSIKELVGQRNQKYPNRYHVVDYSAMLDQLAFKRNGGVPTYEFPEFFRFQYPIPDTKYYHADIDGNLKQGGIFSLDGVHPSAIAHGLIAHETLKVMNGAGVSKSDPDGLDWRRIFNSDDLYQKPISIMHEIYDNERLAELVMSTVKKLRKN